MNQMKWSIFGIHWPLAIHKQCLLIIIWTKKSSILYFIYFNIRYLHWGAISFRLPIQSNLQLTFGNQPKNFHIGYQVYVCVCVNFPIEYSQSKYLMFFSTQLSNRLAIGRYNLGPVVILCLEAFCKTVRYHRNCFDWLKWEEMKTKYTKIWQRAHINSSECYLFPCVIRLTVSLPANEFPDNDCNQFHMPYACSM